MRNKEITSQKTCDKPRNHLQVAWIKKIHR